jgi:anti-sigma factor RsiW
MESHLAGCAECRARAAELGEVSRLVGELPRLEASEPVAQEVLTRLEVETRGPGLALLLRGFGAARPHIVPSLVPAALVLVTVLAATLALDSGPRLPGRIATWGVVPALGTESNPLFPSAGVGIPRKRDGGALAPDVLLEAAGEDALFLETVVARDGTVSTVTVLQGDAEQAGPLITALRQQRFEPAVYRGRPVAISVYRLISSTDVSFPAI